MIRIENADIGSEVLVRMSNDNFVVGHIRDLRLSNSGVNVVYAIVKLKDGSFIEKPLYEMSRLGRDLRK